ncbi:MAG: LLM class flavin-dependent oxidoreductase [Alphaproteobacteria bacterium]|nr:LLM class flavin-dependent oxidoreductase [Alphaproteobacteria bacterium]
MDFGYFMLSDNRYPNNPRTPETLVREIFAQALYAEEFGLNSAWIGEHHFNLLGVNPCPNILLAQLAGATKRIRLGPRRRAVAGSSSASCRRGMGNARPAVGRPDRLRRRPRLRPAGVRAVPGAVSGLRHALRRGARHCLAGLDRAGPLVPSRQVLSVPRH